MQVSYPDHNSERFGDNLRITKSDMQNLTTTCPYCNSSNPGFTPTCATCGSRLQHATLPMGLRLKDGFYELERVLGQGGFGITYLARHTGLGTKVAIKELYPDHLIFRDAQGNTRAQAGMQSEFEGLQKRFQLEAKTLQQLKHRSSAQFISDWFERGTVFIAMEFIDGETLESRIARGALLDEYGAKKVMIPILELLEEVHGKGMLHRDIKPANIILTKNGGVELIDFGSVTKFNTGQRTKITSRLLTPAYAPLEQYGQDVMLTPSTDLYALAATIYEAMTGISPAPALDRVNGTKLKLLENCNPDISPAFSSLIMKALELRMEDRFSSAGEFFLSIDILNKFIAIHQPIPASSQVIRPITSNSQVSFSLSYLMLFLVFFITSAGILIYESNIYESDLKKEIELYSLNLKKSAEVISENIDKTQFKILQKIYERECENLKPDFSNLPKIFAKMNYNFPTKPARAIILDCILTLNEAPGISTIEVTVYGEIPNHVSGYSVDGNSFQKYPY